MVFLGRDFSSSQDYSDDTAAKIDNEIHRIISEAYDLAKRVLTEHMDKLHFVAEFLVRNEVMDGEQFAYAMTHAGVTEQELLDMLDARRQRSAEENRAAAEEEAARAAAEAEARAAAARGEDPNDILGAAADDAFSKIGADDTDSTDDDRQ